MALGDDALTYVFGGNTGLTLEDLKRRQAVASALASQRAGFPKNLGEGIASLGTAIGDRMREERLRQAEIAMQTGGQTKFNQAQQMGTPTPPATSAPTQMGPNTFGGVPYTPVTTRPAAPNADAGLLTPPTPPPGAPAGQPPPAPAAAAAFPPPQTTMGFGSEATPDDPRRSVAAALTNASGVAQGNPTLGAPILAPSLTPVTGSPATSDAAWTQRQNAIAGIETSGRKDPYGTVGPQTVHRDGSVDRPYGRYQVMGQNIPIWTQAALGQAMSPQQFLASPEAQDAVFRYQFGKYVARYGEEGAARAWFAGPGGVGNVNARDNLGTSVGSYGQRYLQGLQKNAEEDQATTSGQQPTRLAYAGGDTMSDAPPIGAEPPAAGPDAGPVQLSALSPGNGNAPPIGVTENPPTPTDIKKVPTQVAQMGPGTIAGALAQPGMLSPLPTPVGPSANRPALPGGTAAPGTGPGMEPRLYPNEAGTMPTAPLPTPQMEAFRRLAHDPYVNDNIRQQAQEEYQRLAGLQNDAYTKAFKLWEERQDPQKQATLAETLGRVEMGKIQVIDGRAYRWDQATQKFVDVTPGGSDASGLPNPPGVTGEERKSVALYSMAKTAQEQFDAIPNADKILADGLAQEALGHIPFVGNSLQASQYQVLRSAANNMVRAKLHNLSGAAFSAKEILDNYREMIPVYGDSPEVQRNKREQRETVVQGLLGESGKARPIALELDRRRQVARAVANTPVTVGSEDDAKRLPSGTKFILNGRTGTVR